MVVLRCKVLLVGDVEVGKTACLQMFHSNGKTFPKNYLSTNGVELTVKVVNIPDSETAVEMYVHDCSGSDLHRSLMPAVVHLSCLASDLSREFSQF
jgi:transport family protein 27